MPPCNATALGNLTPPPLHNPSIQPSGEIGTARGLGWSICRPGRVGRLMRWLTPNLNTLRDEPRGRAIVESDGGSQMEGMFGVELERQTKT